jgi:hypothetical protein
VALKTLVFEVKVIWPLFKKSKIEAVNIKILNNLSYFKILSDDFYLKKKIGWLITFLFVIIFNIDIGLYAGLISSLLIVILKSQRYYFKCNSLITEKTNIFKHKKVNLQLDFTLRPIQVMVSI